jgi:RNA polymerase sigma-70 factor (ECF subfamily)
MPNLSESEIINNAVAGDKHAFRLLVEKHQAFAYSLAYRFLSSKDDAEDVTQEAFIRLWKSMSRYRPEIKITTWLYKIVTNLCLDYLKSRHRRQAMLTQDVDRHIMDDASADCLILESEFSEMVLRMTDELTPKQKAVFILRDLEELEMKEISEILSMSHGNIKSNLYYARMKMGDLIKKCYQEKKKESI